MSFKELKYEDLGESISSIDFSPQGDYMAVGLIDERVIVWKTDFDSQNYLEELYKWDGHSMGVVDVKFNTVGNKLAVSTLDSCVRVWDIDMGSKQSEITCPPMGNWKLAFLCDGKSVITSGECGKVSTFDIETQENTKIVESTDIFSSTIAASTDDKFVAIGNTQGSAFLYDIKDNWKKFRIDCHNKMVRSLSFTQDCLKLVTASDDMSAKVIDLVKLEPIFTFQGHKGNINSVDCSPVDNKLFITASYDKTIKLWDMNQKTCVETISFHSDNIWGAKFNHQGSIIGSVCENGILALHTSK